jgi:hypothetical protein
VPTVKHGRGSIILVEGVLVKKIMRHSPDKRNNEKVEYHSYLHGHIILSALVVWENYTYSKYNRAIPSNIYPNCVSPKKNKIFWKLCYDPHRLQGISIKGFKYKQHII